MIFYLHRHKGKIFKLNGTILKKKTFKILLKSDTTLRKINLENLIKYLSYIIEAIKKNVNL